MKFFTQQRTKAVLLTRTEKQWALNALAGMLASIALQSAPCLQAAQEHELPGATHFFHDPLLASPQDSPSLYWEKMVYAAASLQADVRAHHQKAFNQKQKETEALLRTKGKKEDAITHALASRRKKFRKKRDKHQIRQFVDLVAFAHDLENEIKTR